MLTPSSLPPASKTLTSALLRLDPKSLVSEAPVFLPTLDGILKARPQSLEPALAQYYKVLGKCCHDAGSTQEFVNLVRGAVVTPLVAAHLPSTPIPIHVPP